MYGTVGLVSKKHLQKHIDKWDYINSFSSYHLLSEPEMTLLSPIIALNMRFLLGKSYTYGQGQECPKTKLHRKPEEMPS